MNSNELDWSKSSYDSAQGDDCVEVAVTEQAVYVRDSKTVARSRITVAHDGWKRFVRFTVCD